MTTETSIEARLSSAFGEPMTPRERAVLDTRVRTRLESCPTPRRRMRFRLTRSLVLVVVLMVVLPSVFAVGAAILSTEAPYGMGNAGAYDAELAATKAVTPLPPGATWPPYLDRAIDRSASYGTGLGREMVQYNAYCLWLGYWYGAQNEGNAPAVAAAVAALTEARGWQTFTDPLTSDQGFRDRAASTIDGAARGDAAIVLGELRLNCQGTWP